MCELKWAWEGQRALLGPGWAPSGHGRDQGRALPAALLRQGEGHLTQGGQGLHRLLEHHGETGEGGGGGGGDRGQGGGRGGGRKEVVRNICYIVICSPTSTNTTTSSNNISFII